MTTPKKPKEPLKKQPVLPKVGTALPKLPAGSQNQDGLTGQGSESALAHLRSQEQSRSDKLRGGN